MTEPRRVHILYTGGTIGMQESPRGYVPVKGHLHQMLSRMPQFNDPTFARADPGGWLVTPPSRFGRRTAFDIEEFEEPMDSSDMSHEDWVRIARSVEAKYDAYDAFVILHGTDTMAYTASALSFMFDDLGKTVILTGSQIPLSQVRSDAVENLLGALTIAGHFDIPEVGLYFRNRLFRGNRSVKVDAAGFEAFDSSNFDQLVDVGIEIRVHWDRVRVPPEGPFRVDPITNVNVAALRLFPGLGLETLRNFLRPPTQGLVLESYGSGNAPTANSEFLDVIAEATARGVVVVNVTQCTRGTVTDDYAAGRALREVGVVPGADMTSEAALTKLAWLLSQELDVETVRAQMQRNRRGELTAEDIRTRFSFQERDFIEGVAASLSPDNRPQEVAGIARALYPVLMCSAAAKGEVEALSRMLDDGASPDVADYDLRTPLHLAAASGQLAALDRLVAAGADVHARDRWGGLPLLDALRNGHVEAARLLARKGARLDPADSLGELCRRARAGDAAGVRQLLEFGADPAMTDADERTPLHLAAAEGHLSTVDTLLTFGAPVAAVDRWKRTALEEAVHHGHGIVAARLQAASASS